MLQAIAVTGMSAWTCFGRGLPPLLSALASGQRGLRPIERMPAADPWFRTTEAMQVDPAELLAGIPPGPERERALLDYPSRLGVETALDAHADAGRPSARYPGHRVCVFSGTSHGSNHGLIEVLSQRVAGQTPDLSALGKFSAWTGRRIAQQVGARGPNLTINTACSSGLSSIGQAAKLLSDGRIDCAIAGGSDVFSFLSYAGFNSLMALDRAACRPFDVARDGMSLGDGAAYVVLEREQDARARGARLHGLITGYGCAAEGYHATAPDPSGRGALAVMQLALMEDGSPRDLTLVAAHGTGTPANDSAELAAIADVLAALNIPGPVQVSSIKGYIGHSLGAAGALQVVATLGCMAQGFYPGTAGLIDPIPHQPPIALPLQSLRAERPIRLALCNSFGFGGSVAALCVRSAACLQARSP